MSDLTWKEKLIALVVVGGGVFIVGTTYNRCQSRKATLHLVNLSTTPALSFALDGDIVAENVPSMSNEEPTSVRSVEIKKGKHTVEARTSTGSVVLRVEFDESKTDEDYIFMPTPEQDRCLQVDTATYSASGGKGLPRKRRVLGNTESLHHLPDRVDGWFVEHPSGMTVGKGTERALHTTVRLVSCRRAAVDG